MGLLKGWELKRLGQIAECLDSKRIPLNSQERESKKGSIPYYGANGQVDSINEFIYNEELLLLAEDGGSWGANQKCAYIIRGKSWVNNHAHVLRMKSSVLIKFLQAYLNLSDLTKYITGTTRGKLNQKQMNEIEVPLPPIPLQQEIVALLERAERLKEMRQKANEDTAGIVQSIFYEMFGDPIINQNKWTKITIKDIATNAKGSIRMGPFGSQLKKNELIDNGIRVLWIENIVENQFNYKVGRFITEAKYEQLKGFTVHPGNVLITMMGTIGRVAIVPEDIKKAIISSHLLKIEVDETKCNPVFLKHMILSNFVQNQFKNASHGIVMSGLNTKIINNTSIILPPLKLQNQFAFCVERIMSLEAKQEQSTQGIDTISDALMQKAFSGEV